MRSVTISSTRDFVSLLSDDGMPIEQISRLVGHSGTSVTEPVYRKQIRPVVEDGAVAMDRLFPRPPGAHRDPEHDPRRAGRTPGS